MLKRFPLSTALLLLVACGAVEQTPAGPSPGEAVNTPLPEAPVEEPEYVGVVTARKSEIIPVAFTGRVSQLDVRPGQKVRAGDKIARLDDKDLRLKIEGLKMSEKSASAQAGAHGAIANAARSKLATSERLVRLGAAPRLELNTIGAEAKSGAAQAGAAAAQGEATRFDRRQLERQLEQAQILAPNDGVVMMVRGKLGEVAQQGAPIARIYDPSDLIIRFAVPKEHRNRLAKGGRVQLRIEGVERTLWARIEDFADEEAPINFTVVTADLDDKRLNPDEVSLASIAHVKLVSDKKAAKKSANKTVATKTETKPVEVK